MNPEENLKSEIDRILAQYVQIHDEVETVWKTQIAFKGHWWLDVALAILPWILWFIVCDKKRRHSLLYAGLFSMLAASLLDMAGVSQGGWQYNTLLLPFFPEYLPWDLTVMPVVLMLFLQYFPRLSPWIKGAVFGSLASYVIEPIFAWLGIYEQSGWEHHYSLPIYFAIFMLAYWLYSRSRRECEKRAE